MFIVKRDKEPMQNKTFRLPVALLARMEEAAHQNDISLNELVRQCCSYAMEDYSDRSVLNDSV